jgi:hypothetical protein
MPLTGSDNSLGICAGSAVAERLRLASSASAAEPGPAERARERAQQLGQLLVLRVLHQGGLLRVPHLA